MDKINLSQANQVYLERLKTKAEVNVTSTSNPEKKSNNKKKIILALSALSAIAIAGVAIYKGKNPKAKEIIFKNLNDINFNKGEATLKENGEKFTGIIKDTLKNGDTIQFEYKNGVLEKSIRKGEVNFEKIHETIDGNKKITTIFDDNSKTEVFLKDLKDSANLSQKKQKAQEALKQEQATSEKIKAATCENSEIASKELEIQKQQARKNLQKTQEELNLATEKRNENDEAELDFYKKQIAFIEAKIEDLKLNSPEEYIIFEKELKKDLNTNGFYYKKLQNYLQTKQIDMSEANLIDEVYTYYGPKYSNIKTKDPEAYKKLTKNSKEFDFLNQNKNITLSSDVNLFEDFTSKTYDVPERFAIMADNNIKKTGNAYILDDTPEIFKGLDQKEVADCISKFARKQGGNKYYTFTIGGKKFSAEVIGAGEVGKAYKLTDSSGRECAIKIYSSSRGKSLNLNCGLSEIATSRQLAKDNVGDVPKFYMANAGLYKLGNDGKMHEDNPWMICDFIDNQRKPKTNTIKLNDWLKNHNMHYSDAFKNGRTEGGILLDVGGIVSNNWKDRKDWGTFGLHGNRKLLDLNSLLENSLKEGMGVEEILKIFH